MIHLKTVHEGGVKPTYNCSLCDYKSQEKSETLKHVKEVHKELSLNSIFSEKQKNPSAFYKCINCEFTTSDKGVLLKHLKKHKGANYWAFSPLVPSKRDENVLVLLSLYIF